MKKAITGLIIILLSLAVFASAALGFKSTIDYIQKTNRLWGIAAVRINKDNSVTLVDAKSGNGYALMLSLTEALKSVTIKIGDAGTLSDGHHVFITYKLRAINEDKITFIVTDEFDARSFGGVIEKASETVIISAYNAE